MKRISFLLLFFLTLFFSADAQYSFGDFGAYINGGAGGTANWGTTNAIWKTWDGFGWNNTPLSAPSYTDNVFILSGDTVVITTSASTASCKTLTVEAGAKLYCNDGTPAANGYANVWGNIICNGVMGNKLNYDNISLNIEGANDTITGTGSFDVSRIRKSSNSINATTNVFVNRSINLTFNNSGFTQVYNNVAGSIFNVTVASGDTLYLLNGGSAAVDGIDGAASGERGGTFTINGAMIASGILYLTNNNANSTYSCKWIVNGYLAAYQVNSPKSGWARDSLTINNGGKLNLTGTPAFASLAAATSDSNTFIFNTGSTVEYSASGNQTVRVSSDFGGASLNQYYNLIISGSGTKTLDGLMAVKNDLTISNATGLPVMDASTNNINVGGNWTNYSSSGFTEGSGVQTVTLNGTAATGRANQTITCAGGEVFNNLTLSKTGAGTVVYMNNNVDVNKVLTFSATDKAALNLHANKLTLLNNATTAISGAMASNTRYIISDTAIGTTLAYNPGIVQWNMGTPAGTYVYPFGTNGSFIPVAITKAATATTVSMSIATRSTGSNNQPWDSITNVAAVTNMNSPVIGGDGSNAAVIDRWWEITPSTPITADVTFTYRGSENTLSAIYQTSSLAAQNWNGVAWSAPVCTSCNNGVIAGTGTVVVNGASLGNAPWVLSSSSAPLPIELTSFSAEKRDDKVKLEWITSSEINNDFFSIERSIDGNLFEEVGRINGAGNSTEDLYYEFMDNHPAHGLSYYRLRQVDFDGRCSFSSVVSVLFESGKTEIVLYPNPATGNIFLLSSEKRKVYTLRIFDINGVEVQSASELIFSETNRLEIDIRNLSKGFYFLQFDSDDNVQTLKLVKE